jgi:uncharacterized repeat protein (TIGR03806 family)
MSRHTACTMLGVAGLMLLSGLGCQRDAKSKPESALPVEVTESTISSEPPAKRISSVKVDVDARRPAKLLSDYGLFEDLTDLVPDAAVISYELNAHSFMDHAIQESFLYLPAGKAAEYQAEGAFRFPVGTILGQHVRFPADQGDATQQTRPVETRLLIHMTQGWTAVPYVWNEDGSDADRAVIGEKTDVSTVLQNGEQHLFTFLTPNMNECRRCHVNEDVMYPIGVTAANLNRTVEVDGHEVNQLVDWQQRGLLTGLPDTIVDVPRIPDWEDSSSATVERRARSWLDVNCSHCHNPRGAASTSGLDLTFQQDQPVRFGVFKPPVAAGRGSQGLKFSILPQRPDESFMVRRIDSTELGVMMPPLGRTTVHHAGVELIRRWITEMEVDEALAEAARNPMKAYRDAGDGTGNAGLGREIFHKGQKCITCHRVGDEGGNVGPNLSDVGKRTKRDYLLESIVMPSAKIVKGFETLAIVDLDGRIVTGTVQSEDEYEIVIADAKNQTRIKKEDIDERIVSDVSTMPTLANLLSVDDVRNLIAYLETLQETPKD